MAIQYTEQLESYKGYRGLVAYSEPDEIYFGKIADIKDLVNFEGQTLEETQGAFHEAVDDYDKSLVDIGRKS